VVHIESSPAPPDFQPIRDCASLSQARKFVPAIDCIGSRRPLTAMGSGWFSFRSPSSNWAVDRAVLIIRPDFGRKHGWAYKRLGNAPVADLVTFTNHH